MTVNYSLINANMFHCNAKKNNTTYIYSNQIKNDSHNIKQTKQKQNYLLNTTDPSEKLTRSKEKGGMVIKNPVTATAAAETAAQASPRPTTT